MSRPTQIIIDLAALQHNYARVRELAPGRAIMAMVKANGYGHGLERIAQVLPEADAFGVASLEEGLRLREVGITQPIVLMEGLFYADELSQAIKQDFTLVIHHIHHVEMIEKGKCQQPLKIWLKVNTGMHRLGFDPEMFAAVYRRLEGIPAIQKPMGLMTHFAQADTLQSTATAEQIACFEQVIAHLQGPLSLANSAGILGWPASHGDWVRPGIMLYGASPFLDKTGRDHELQPVMTLQSQLIAVHPVKKGSRVGYGGTWTAPEDMQIGVVGVGYGDGYPQFAKNGTPVLVNGQLAKLVGRVSMDMLTVDLSLQPAAQIGDPVILWGEGLPVEYIAQASGTSVYELLTRMTQRPKVEVKS